MDYLKILHENPDLAEEFDSLFDFFLLNELVPAGSRRRPIAPSPRPAWRLPEMAPAGEYHLLEDGSIGYYSSEGETGRLAESMDDLFSRFVSCICWHDCCDAKEYVDSTKHWRNMGREQRNTNLEDMDVDSLRRVSDALVFLPVSRWLWFWSDSAKQPSVSLCISVYFTRTTEA